MIQAIRGTRDILTDESGAWRLLETTAARVFGRYGFREVRTPLLEKTELFARAVGETTDIVEKEMYTFADRGGESLSLRPEGTASVVRAFINNSLDRQLPWRVWYAGPMFRYERPQKGRYRQFHQIGCELFGPEGPLADAEVMAMAMRFLDEIGLGDGLTLEINTLGCPACRPAYRELLVNELRGRVDGLCPLCQQRLERNPLRVLDCKEHACRELAHQAPAMVDHLCPGCQGHWQGLQRQLSHFPGLPVQHNPLMVRGLDYYTRTAFEITTPHLGAQNAVAAGGRYDGLVGQMGGRPTPAIGFAMGVERLALLLGERRPHPVTAPDATLVAVGEQAVAQALGVAETLRAAGVAVECHAEGSFKSQMKKADRSGSPWVIILGDDEAARGQVQLKNMADGQQTLMTIAETLPILRGER